VSASFSHKSNRKQIAGKTGKPAPLNKTITQRRSSWNFTTWAIVLLTGILFLFRIELLQHRYFDQDEFEHLHASWLVSVGKTPYVDFFEHHTPWLYYAFAPMYTIIHANENPNSACSFICFARVFPLFLSAGVLLLLILVGKTWGDLRLGLISAFLASCLPVFLRKTLEFRPDVPALTLWSASLALLASEFTASEIPLRRTSIRLFFAGMCVGGAIMFTQKMLFVLPGFGAGLIFWALYAQPQQSVPIRLRACGACVLGILAPFLLTWSAFALSGAGRQFIENNFFLNARWKLHISPLVVLNPLLIESWPLIVLGLGGGVFCWLTWEKKPDWTGRHLSLIVVGILAGLLVIPVAQEQYYLMLAPPLALLGARYLIELISSIPKKFQELLLCACIVGLCIIPGIAIKTELTYSNEAQLRGLKLVMTRASPNESVMDGWRGLGVFRPHAFYYFFLHPEIRAMLPERDLDIFLSRLESGEIKPKLIILDDNLNQLSPRFSRYLAAHYKLDNAENIYMRSAAE
jgi:hypothetical protein